jgi:hypothetical protein
MKECPFKVEQQVALECGIHAIHNLLFANNKQTKITCESAKELALEMARAARAEGFEIDGVEIQDDHFYDEGGNYSADVLVTLLKNENYYIPLHFKTLDGQLDRNALGYLKAQKVKFGKNSTHYVAIVKSAIGGGWCELDSLNENPKSFSSEAMHNHLKTKDFDGEFRYVILAVYNGLRQRRKPRKTTKRKKRTHTKRKNSRRKSRRKRNARTLSARSRGKI